jgi:hypothetical protein
VPLPAATNTSPTAQSTRLAADPDLIVRAIKKQRVADFNRILLGTRG